MNNPFQQHGAFSWSELLTTDVAAAKKFYSRLFGWTTEDMQMDGGFTYTVVKAEADGIGGIMSMPPQAGEMPPHWGVYVTVNDVDATAKLAEELGAKILLPPRDIPKVGRFCVLQDPQGAVISAITYLKM